MALELLVTAWSPDRRPRSRSLAWIVGAVATLTAIGGAAARIAAGSSTAHSDAGRGGQLRRRINLAAVVGVLIKAICGRRPRPRTDNPAPCS